MYKQQHVVCSNNVHRQHANTITLVPQWFILTNDRPYVIISLP